MSPDSAELPILAATITIVPEAPTTMVSDEFVVVQWVAPYNGGTAILAYSVQILTSDGVTFA